VIEIARHRFVRRVGLDIRDRKVAAILRVKKSGLFNGR
jgi:hypothetical protein